MSMSLSRKRQEPGTEEHKGDIMTDKKYEEARNELIPFAERYANDLHGTTHGARDRNDWVCDWNTAYLGEMTGFGKWR